MRSTYIGLPTRDVARATDFFTGLGFTLDPRASDQRTACIVVNDITSVMLHSADWFTEFTGFPVSDPDAGLEVSIGITTQTRDEVDDLCDRAVAAGAQDRGPLDLGYMYMRAFRDLDGHRWSFMYFAQPG